MSDSVQMPALGESVTEGTVTRWLKAIGDRVEVDEPLLEVSTDKVDTEIPSPVAGVLEQILVNEDETVDIGTPLAMIGDGSGAGGGDAGSGGASESQPEQPAEQPAQQQPAQQAEPQQQSEPEPQPEPQQSQPEPQPEPQQPEPAQAQSSPPSNDGGSGGGTEVAMPALGESVTEGTVTRWLKQVGEQVEVDEPLLEVSTDKVDTEIPSPVAGTLSKILVNEDETVDVGTPLAIVGGSGDASAQAPSDVVTPTMSGPAQDQPSAPPEAAPQSQAQAESSTAQPAQQAAPAPQQPAQPEAPQQAPAPQDPPQAEPAQAPAPPPATAQPQAPAQAPAPQQPAPAPSASPQPAAAAAAPPAPSAAPAAPATENANGHDGAGYVTPLVRRMASEQGVDLSTIKGTGVGGRIRKQDVIDAGKAKAAEEAKAKEAQSQPAPAASSAPSGGAPAAPRQVAVSALRGTTEKMSRLRKVIAQRMVDSLQTSAQLTTVVEVDVTKIARLRDRAKADFAAREGVKLSFLPFFALAAVEALKQHPKLNASIDGDQVVYHAEENLSIAVDTERGLVGPVIHSAGDLNIAGLARKIQDLADRTRRNKITPDEISGGTFTLTNTGSRGALFDTPILFLPQVAILGTGVVVKRPVVVTDEDGAESIAIRSIVYLALSYDHRLIDGADAARFLTTIKSRLEEGAFEGDLGL